MKRAGEVGVRNGERGAVSLQSRRKVIMSGEAWTEDAKVLAILNPSLRPLNCSIPSSAGQVLPLSFGGVPTAQ